MTGGSPWQWDPPVGRALQPWFFWDEEPEEIKPGRLARFKLGKAARAGETAKAGKPVRAAPEPGPLSVPEAAPTTAVTAVPTAPGAERVPRAKPVPEAEPAPDADPDGGHRESRARLVRRPMATAAVLAGLLTIVGGTVGLSRLTGRPADVPRPLAKPAPAPRGSFAAPPEPHSSKRVALPVELTIPAIHVRTTLETLGRTPQGTLQVPDTTTVAGWYTGSPRPGEIGSSIIAGHIDSTTGPGVFFRLRLLRQGELVYVRRADGTLVVFRVTAERMYAKDKFPTEQVYGPVPDAELHLITCGGVFDSVTGSYLSNVVVYAAQISVQPPRHQHGRRHRHHPRARHS